MSKHTPGPWILLPKNDYTFTQVFANEPRALIADVIDDVSANVLRAAPELLEALKWLLHNTDMPDDVVNPEIWRNGWSNAVAVIARAEGRDEI